MVVSFREFERDHSSSGTGLTAVDLISGVALQSGVVYFRYGRALLQIFRYVLGVGAVTVHSDPERLYTSEEKERVERS